MSQVPAAGGGPNPGAPNPSQCVRCGAPVGISGGRCPFCGTEQPKVVPTGPSNAATVGLNDANRMSMGRPPLAPKKKSSMPLVLGLLTALVFLVAVVGGVAGWLYLRPSQPVVTSASANVTAVPPAPSTPAKVLAGIAIEDATKVDPSDYLPKAKKAVMASFDPDAKLLEIVVAGAKNGSVDLSTSGAEIVYRYVNERDPRAPKGKETRQRMEFVLKAGGPEAPGKTNAIASDRGAPEPNCIWSAAWRAAVAAGIDPKGPVEARYAIAPKGDEPLWTFTSGNTTKQIDGVTCAIKVH